MKRGSMVTFKNQLYPIGIIGDLVTETQVNVHFFDPRVNNVPWIKPCEERDLIYYNPENYEIILNPNPAQHDEAIRSGMEIIEMPQALIFEIQKLWAGDIVTHENKHLFPMITKLTKKEMNWAIFCYRRVFVEHA